MTSAAIVAAAATAIGLLGVILCLASLQAFEVAALMLKER
jgi:hypothetical protein